MRSTALFPVLILVLFAMLLAVLAAPPAFSAGITDAKSEGICRDFQVSVSTEGLEGCWDMKVDLPGRILNKNTGVWESSYFYLEDAICSPAQEASVSFSLESKEPVVSGDIRLRQNSTVLEKQLTISQQCPQPVGDIWVIVVAAAVILVFCFMLIWWWKKS